MYGDFVNKISNDGLCIYPSHEVKGAGIVIGGGPGMASRVYRQLLNPLVKDVPLTTWDYRGTGESQPKSVLSSEQDYRDLISVLDLVHGSEPATVMAHSYGCALALRLVNEHPERVRRLILMGGALSFEPVMEGAVKRKFKNMALSDFLKLLGTVMMAATVGERPSLNRKFVRLEAKNQISVLNDSAVDRLSDLFDISLRVLMTIRDFIQWDFAEIAAKIQVPTLVISGANDIIVPKEFSRSLADAIPGSQYLCIPECGHWPFIEKPDIFVRSVAGICDSTAL